MITKKQFQVLFINPMLEKFGKKYFTDDDNYKEYLRDIYAILKYHPFAFNYIEKMLAYDSLTGAHVLTRWISDE